jgi:serine/threonine protein kinase
MHATLTDFGLSHVMSGTVCLGTRTMMAGTPGYQSPEQLRAENVGVASDVYAFGCVTIFTYTEEPLWPGLTPFQILLKVTVENNVPSTTNTPPSIAQLCNSCIADVTKRPAITSVLQTLLQFAKYA